MPYRKTPFVNDYFYHVYNRGVAKQPTFSTHADYQRLLESMYYYQFSDPKPSFSTYKRFKIQDFETNPKIVDIIAYCLMPNHFHMLVRQTQDRGIQHFMRKVFNSYTKYYNTRHKRVGPLFQGEFKAVLIESDEQLLHVSRYIHLNPYVDGLTKALDTFPYSSYSQYIGKRNSGFCIIEPIMSFYKDTSKYKGFIEDHQDYAKQLENIKHLTHE